MYKGFNLDLQNKKHFDDFSRFYNGFYQKQREEIRIGLKKFIDMSGNLLGEKIMKDWFPNNIRADIFISHSHQDKDLAISFAGWLKQNFKLESFIDSTVWWDANNLLKIIDNEYCKKENGYYDYNRRNYSTSHVHMMLSVSLMRMMDKCECVIFINTPKSYIPSEELNSGMTLSPWIFSEISMAKMLRIQLPERKNIVMDSLATESRDISESSPLIKHQLNIEHLPRLDVATLEKWKNQNNKQGSASLDTLYKLVSQIG